MSQDHIFFWTLERPSHVNGLVIGGSGRDFFHPLEGNTYQGSLKRYMLAIGWLYTTYHFCTRTSHHPLNMGPTPWKINMIEKPTAITHEKKGTWSSTRPPWGRLEPSRLIFHWCIFFHEKSWHLTKCFRQVGRFVRLVAWKCHTWSLTALKLVGLYGWYM